MFWKRLGVSCVAGAAFGLALAAPVRAQAPATTGPSLCGVVRASDATEPLADVRVEVVGAPQATRTNARGGYCLLLTRGLHRLLVSRHGYAPQALSVVAGDDSLIALDVTLVAHAVPLRQVRVRAFARDRWPHTRPPLPWDAEPGERRLLPHADAAFSDADALSSVTSTPDGAASGPEPGASLHVRGGSADQNLVLLDGVPLYQPYHMTGAMSVLSPDVVTDGSLHAGIPTARLGGGLSSIVELRSRDAESGRWSTTGGIVGGLARLSVGGSLPGERGSFIIGGRTSARGVPGFTGDASNTTIGLSDTFGKASVPLGRGVLEFLSLSATDRLAFATIAGLGTAGPVASVDGAPAAADLSAATEPPRNRLDRSSSTMALVWYSDTNVVPRAGARLWRTTSVTAGDWLATGGTVRLDHALSSLGASADATWRIRNGEVVAGFQVERLRTRYLVGHASTAPSANGVPAGAPMLSFDLERLFASPFVEAHWRLDPKWSLTVGVRDQLADGALAGIEPRLALRFRANPWLSLSAAAGRLHQPLQAFNNHESIFATFLGGALPVVLEGPMARADRLDIGASLSLGPRAAFTVDAYANQFGSLTQVAPASAQPFAIDGVSSAHGRSSGVLLGLTYEDPRLSAHAAYAYAAGERAADGVRYVPAIGDTHTFSAAMSYWVRSSTRVRVALWAGAGRRTTLTAGDLEWAPTPLVSGEDLAGGPQRWLGALGAATLPPFLRVDVGVSHAWDLHVGLRTLTLTSKANVLNVLARNDARGLFVPGNGGARRFAYMLPRTVTLGLEWAY